MKQANEKKSKDMLQSLKNVLVDAQNKISKGTFDKSKYYYNNNLSF